LKLFTIVQLVAVILTALLAVLAGGDGAQWPLG